MDEEQNRPADPWEEEIDLRELIIGIAKKWYIWIGLPFLVMIITAGYLFLTVQPTYILEAEYWFDDIAFDVPGTERLLPDESRLRRRMTSIDEFAPLFRKIYENGVEFEDEEDAREKFRNFLDENVKISVDQLQISVEVQTPYPEHTARFLDRWFEKIEQIEKEGILQRHGRLISHLENRLQNVRDRHNDWLETVAFPDVIFDEAEHRLFRETAEFLPGEAQFLKIQSDFAERITDLEERINYLEDFLPEIEEELGEYYSPQLPAEELPRNRARNTLLAGVVTGLLALFGTAFWEIL